MMACCDAITHSRRAARRAPRRAGRRAAERAVGPTARGVVAASRPSGKTAAGKQQKPDQKTDLFWHRQSGPQNRPAINNLCIAGPFFDLLCGPKNGSASPSYFVIFQLPCDPRNTDHVSTTIVASRARILGHWEPGSFNFSWRAKVFLEDTACC